MTKQEILDELKRLNDQAKEMHNQLEALDEEYMKLQSKREELEFVLKGVNRHIGIVEKRLERDYPK